MERKYVTVYVWGDIHDLQDIRVLGYIGDYILGVVSDYVWCSRIRGVDSVIWCLMQDWGETRDHCRGYKGSYILWDKTDISTLGWTHPFTGYNDWKKKGLSIQLYQPRVYKVIDFSSHTRNYTLRTLVNLNWIKYLIKNCCLPMKNMFIIHKLINFLLSIIHRNHFLV